MNQFRRNVVFLTILAFCLVMNVLTGCTNKPEQSNQVASNDSTATAQTADNEENVAMKAPQISVGDDGVICLAQCPTENEHIKVVVSEDQDEVTIFFDGEKFQTLTDKEDGFIAAGSDSPVFFMDADFDGMVDIFIGPGESRTYSSLLVWDPAAKEFKRIGTLGSPALQNCMLTPSTKSVFDGGSSSAFSSYFTRSEWENGSLVVKEALNIVTDPEEYAENNVTNKFTLMDASEKVILSTDDASKLPGSWANILGKMEFE